MAEERLQLQNSTLTVSCCNPDITLHTMLKPGPSLPGPWDWHHMTISLLSQPQPNTKLHLPPALHSQIVSFLLPSAGGSSPPAPRLHPTLGHPLHHFPDHPLCPTCPCLFCPTSSPAAAFLLLPTACHLKRDK